MTLAAWPRLASPRLASVEAKGDATLGLPASRLRPAPRRAFVQRDTNPARSLARSRAVFSRRVSRTWRGPARLQLGRRLGVSNRRTLGLITVPRHPSLATHKSHLPQQRRSVHHLPTPWSIRNRCFLFFFFFFRNVSLFLSVHLVSHLDFSSIHRRFSSFGNNEGVRALRAVLDVSTTFSRS